MEQQFSDETQQLLDRAQSAIDDSFKLVEIGARQLALARRHLFDLEEHYSGFCRALEPRSLRGTESSLRQHTLSRSDRNV
jgi:hypothetical protein